MSRHNFKMTKHICDYMSENKMPINKKNMDQIEEKLEKMKYLIIDFVNLFIHFSYIY
jgi:hypothetical protein